MSFASPIALGLVMVAAIIAIVIGSIAVSRTQNVVTTGNIPSNVVLLDAVQTLNNKILNSPAVYHLLSSGAAPTVTLGSGAITGLSLSAESTDTSGTILGTVTGVNTATAQINIQFSTWYVNRPSSVSLTVLNPEMAANCHFFPNQIEKYAFVIDMTFTGNFTNVSPFLFSYLVIGS